MQLSERSYPILSRVCIGVGVTFLALSAFGNWRFGWSLSTDPIDQWWLAIIYAGSDVAAGVLVATGATMLRHPGWRWKVGGAVALFPATILVALSVLSTFGMMSGRIAVHAGQKAALAVDMGRIEWLRGQTMNRERPKAERRTFMREEREAAKQTREAASVVTDNQAVAIVNAAALVGVKVTTEQTQVGLTFVSSTMPMMIKFVCLGIGFFLFGAKTSEAGAGKKTQAASEPPKSGSGPTGSGEPTKPRLVHPEPEPAAVARTTEAAPVPEPKVSTGSQRVPEAPGPQITHKTNGYSRRFSKDEAEADLHRITNATGTQPSQETLAKMWGVSQQTVSRWRSEWNDTRVKALGRVLRNSVRTHGGKGASPAYGH
jgi:hypothetical protein